MSLDFAIIPINKSYLSAAYNIQTQLQTNITTLDINITIDTDYHISFNTRVNKWKKQEYDIIIINQDYDESNSIIVRFSDKGSKSQIMEIDELINLISSFEDDQINNINDIVNKENETCIIM